MDKTTAQQPKVQQFETDRRQGLEKKIIINNFLSKLPNLIIRQEVVKLKLSSQQELRDLQDKAMAQQPRVQQFESISFQNAQEAAAAEPSGRQGGIYIYIYYKFFGGKIFSATRVVFSTKILKCGAQEICVICGCYREVAENCALLVVGKLPLLAELLRSA